MTEEITESSSHSGPPIMRIRFCAGHYKEVVELGGRDNWQRIEKTGKTCGVEGCDWLAAYVEKPFDYLAEPE